jgi:hypothetical protein
MSTRSRRKRKPHTQPRQSGPSQGQSEGKRSWSRSDTFAVVGIVVGLIAVLLSLALPEARQFFGLDHASLGQSLPPSSQSWPVSPTLPGQSPSVSPTPSVYRLRTAYTGRPVSSSGGPQQGTATISLRIDWESPVGDVAGSLSGDSLQGFCFFRGTVTIDMHFKFTCQGSDQSFDGYVYLEDGHIKGTLASGSSLTLWYFEKDSQTPANTIPTIPPLTPTPTANPPNPVPTPGSTGPIP